MQKILLAVLVFLTYTITGCSDSGDSSPIGGTPITGECGTGDGGYLTPYVICTPSELGKVKDNVIAHYVLKNDIAIAGADDWQPIGSSRATAFSGVFNGNGYTISNLKISKLGTTDYLGLFGYISGGTVTNLNVLLAPSGIEGRNFVGGIAGKVSNGSKITNCSVNGNLSARNITGGIAGEVQASTVENSVSRGVINASGSIGGIAGNMRDDAKIENCYSEMNLNAQNYVGGVAGEVYSGSTVSKCYATGVIDGQDTSSTHIGGVVGTVSESKISSVFANNTSILGRIFVNRVAGDFVLSTENDSFANAKMVVFGMQNAGLAGTTISDADALNKSNYERAGWQFGSSADKPWKITDSYPKLFFEK